jgi:hypothetical protein
MESWTAEYMQRAISFKIQFVDFSARMMTAAK